MLSKLVVLFIGIAIFASCGSSHQYISSFKEIDYSFDNGWNSAFSIRLFADGTFICAKGRSTKKTYYVAKVDYQKLQEIEKTYLHLIDCAPDSNYQESITDASSYKIVEGERSYHVYGTGEPECVHALNDIFQWLSRRRMKPIDTKVDFKSLVGFYPPAISIDSSAFIPPQKISVNYSSRSIDTVINFSIEGLSLEGSEVTARYIHDTIREARWSLFGETGQTNIIYNFLPGGHIKAVENQYSYKNIWEVTSTKDMILKKTIHYVMDSGRIVEHGKIADITDVYAEFAATVPLVLTKKQ